MTTHRRPNARDWVAGIVAGALLGLALLGVGGRIGMRIIALAQGQSAAFSFEGSLTVVLLGAAAGAAVGVIFLLSRTLFPRHRALRTGFFWIVTGTIVARGLNPVSVLNVSVFAPLFVAHGALMYAYWCRIRFAPSSAMKLAATLLVVAAALIPLHTSHAQQPPPTTRPLQPGEVWGWSIRASHTDATLIAAGDSQDVVLLRSRCKPVSVFGSLAGGCWDESVIRMAPSWGLNDSRIASVRALPEGSWHFGPGVAGARVYGKRAGATLLTALLPDGTIVRDSVWVVSAPGAVRIRLEPKPDSILAGDTVRFRVVALDGAGHVVATLGMHPFTETAGPADSLGWTPVRFFPWETGGTMVVRLGRMEDSLPLRFFRPRAPR